ncbi:MAG: mandelate racemase/muconate lactonizing enzyme family protein [Rubrobacter sp.]|nr:mandelate racemase/muconate lactonizing enzyme family protein [Rubrobacter sp.]
MKVSRIETLRLEEFPNLLFVQVHTDEGLVGLGETFFGARAVEAYVHESVAPYLLGRDPLHIDRHARELHGYLGYGSSGAETRGNSAVDIALWDLFGKVTGQPVYQLLGGPSRESIRVYNTCAGYRYVREAPRQAVSNWGLGGGEKMGPYEDLDAFLYRADELAKSLLAEGITGMKIWPFDPYAEASGGQYISESDLQKGLEPFRKIRAAVGREMDVMVEFHSLWNLPTAQRIARALEEFDPSWFEDPLKADNLDALAEFAASTHVPIAASETLAGHRAFRELMDKRAAKVVMLDISWCGGLSEAKKIATLAEAHQLPVAPHDCTGPVVLTASTHLSLNLPNALVQETVRAYYAGWYGELVTKLPTVANGYIVPPEGPGLGTELLPDLHRRPDAHLVASKLGDR